MKISSGFLVMLFAAWTAFMFLSISAITGSKIHGTFHIHRGDGSTVTATISRRLKETSHRPSTKEQRDLSTVILEDYHPIDPVPSSKASVKPGPIEHGAPIIPYIPKPSPPDPPTRGGSG